MAKGLVLRMRTCSAKERKSVAFELSRAGTDEAISELIRMVNAEVRICDPSEIPDGQTLRKPHWWSRPWTMRYQIHPWGHYNYDDQIAGIEALGETQSSKALEFLRNLAVHTPPELIQDVQYNPEKFRDAFFPNAKGELQYWLGVARAETFVGWQGAYGTLQHALGKLEFGPIRR